MIIRTKRKSKDKRRSFQMIIGPEGKPARGSVVLVPTWYSLIQPQTLYFSRDVLKLISPVGILVAKAGAHTHGPLGMAK